MHGQQNVKIYIIMFVGSFFYNIVIVNTNINLLLVSFYQFTFNFLFVECNLFIKV